MGPMLRDIQGPVELWGSAGVRRLCRLKSTHKFCFVIWEQPNQTARVAGPKESAPFAHENIFAGSVSVYR